MRLFYLITLSIAGLSIAGVVWAVCVAIDDDLRWLDSGPDQDAPHKNGFDSGKTIEERARG